MPIPIDMSHPLRGVGIPVLSGVSTSSGIRGILGIHILDSIIGACIPILPEYNRESIGDTHEH